MQPFDDITSPDLGFEDDVLSAAPGRQGGYSEGAGQQPTPKWMRPSSPSTPFSLLSSVLHKTFNILIPLLHRFSTTVLLPLLRPRLTFRYLLFSSLSLYATYRFLTGRPLLASNLPPYSAWKGAYDVGAVDIEVPLDKSQKINNITFKATGKPAFEVETVLFTLYYPTHKKGGKDDKLKLYWIPKPVSATAEGYARALGLNNLLLRPLLTFALWLVAGGITIPAHVGAPLVPPDAMILPPPGTNSSSNVVVVHNSEDGTTFPVLVFSHGMLSSRTDYTAYLGALASRGVVVAALEHRDGSSPGSYVSPSPRQRGEPRRRTWRFYFGLGDLDLDSAGRRDDDAGGGEFDTAALKRAQLDFRAAEMDAAVAVLRQLNAGTTASALRNSRREVGNFDPALFAGRLATDRITLAGHSYGGTGVLHSLGRTESSFFAGAGGAVVLDPGKSSGPLNGDIGAGVPLLVCHSASWSRRGVGLFFGRPHFDVVRGIVEGVNNNASSRGAGAAGWFLTSLGTAHPSITDAPLLQPVLLAWATGSTMGARDGVAQYVLVTADFVAFQHGAGRRGVLALSGRDGGVVRREFRPRDNEGMPVAWRRYWQLHVAPE